MPALTQTFERQVGLRSKSLSRQLAVHVAEYHNDWLFNTCEDLLCHYEAQIKLPNVQRH